MTYITFYFWHNFILFLFFLFYLPLTLETENVGLAMYVLSIKYLAFSNMQRLLISQAYELPSYIGRNNRIRESIFLA